MYIRSYTAILYTYEAVVPNVVKMKPRKSVNNNNVIQIITCLFPKVFTNQCFCVEIVRQLLKLLVDTVIVIDYY